MNLRFHLQQNAQAYVPRQSMKPELGRDLRRVFNASDLAEAQDRLAALVQKYQETAPKLSQWIETDVVEGLSLPFQSLIVVVFARRTCRSV